MKCVMSVSNQLLHLTGDSEYYCRCAENLFIKHLIFYFIPASARTEAKEFSPSCEFVIWMTRPSFSPLRRSCDYHLTGRQILRLRTWFHKYFTTLYLIRLSSGESVLRISRFCRLVRIYDFKWILYSQLKLSLK
jgi:hypothetical protein